MALVEAAGQGRVESLVENAGGVGNAKGIGLQKAAETSRIYGGLNLPL